jgi:hypothetical protein
MKAELQSGFQRIPASWTDVAEHSVASNMEVSRRLAARLSEQLRGLHAEVLQAYPVQDYVQHLCDYPRVASFKHMSRAVGRYCDGIRALVGDAGLDLYHRLLLLQLIPIAQQRLPDTNLPASVRLLYQSNFARIVRDVELDQSIYYLYPRLNKDLGLCSLRLIPCGAFKVHMHGIAWRYLLRRPGDVPRCVRLLASHLRGRKPLYESHLDARDRVAMLGFNRTGWTWSLVTAAELLERNPDVKGMFGGAWFHDPKLPSVSPKLAFLSELAAETGAVKFDLGPCDAQGVRDATWMAAERKSLWEHGKYRPRAYLIVWPRGPLIAWAQRQRLAEAETANALGGTP